NTSHPRIGSDVIEPASMPVVADHDAADDPTGLIFPNKHVRAWPCLSKPEVRNGIVVTSDQAAHPPQFDGAVFVVRRSALYFQMHNDTLPSFDETTSETTSAMTQLRLVRSVSVLTRRGSTRAELRP